MATHFAENIKIKKETPRISSDKTEENEWVSFGEEPQIPLIPQPPSLADDTSSENYIERLEKKLYQMKNPSEITSRNIISALTEARESQMNNMVDSRASYPTSSHYDQRQTTLHFDEELTESQCCCTVLCNHLFPKQAKTTQEVECLLDEDELAIVNSGLDPNDP